MRLIKINRKNYLYKLNLGNWWRDLYELHILLNCVLKIKTSVYRPRSMVWTRDCIL